MTVATPHWSTTLLGTHDWRDWLSNHGSLTRRLRQRCPDFRVRRLRQNIDLPHPDERTPLDLRPGQRALIREVLLDCGETPLVFAHTVVPLASLHGPWQALTGLGNRPLGEALFANPRVARHPLEYRRVDPRHPLHRAACRSTRTNYPSLWARRSLFALEGHPLLVNEVFLPAVLDLP